MINLPIIIGYTYMNLPKVEYRRTLYMVTMALEGVLMICHCWWFWKILKAVSGAAHRGSREFRDNRSDDSA